MFLPSFCVHFQEMVEVVEDLDFFMFVGMVPYHGEEQSSMDLPLLSEKC